MSNFFSNLITLNWSGDQRHYISLSRQKIIYGRVPKVANSSIKEALARALDEPFDPGVRKTKDRFWKKATRGQTRMITKAQAMELNSECFSFSFVRNPFDRVVSCYNNKIISNDTVPAEMQAMNLYHGMPFEEFAAVLARTPDRKMDVHLLPQATILKIEGEIVPKFVGRLENIKNDWKILAEIMAAEGIPTLGKLPAKNVRRTKSEEVTTYFNSRETIGLIYERYRDDVETFYSGVSVSDLVERRGGIGMPPIVAI